MIKYAFTNHLRESVDSDFELNQFSGFFGVGVGCRFPVWRRVRLVFRLASCQLEAAFKIASLRS
jgi:hypothetical protein